MKHPFSETPVIRPHYVALYQSICRSKKLAALPDDTCRLFFHDLLTHLDSFGRGEADAATLNAAVWPMLNKSIVETERALQALQTVGLIVLYEVAGDRFLYEPTWEEHAGRVGRLDRRGDPLWPDPNSDAATRCGSSPADAGVVPPRARARIRSDPIRELSDPIRSDPNHQESEVAEDKPRRERKPATGPVADCIRHWESEWTRTRLGTKCAIQAKDGVAVAWMTKQVDDPHEVQRRMTAMLEDPDYWVAQNASLPLLRSKWDRFACQVIPNGGRKGGLPTGLAAVAAVAAMRGGAA